MRRPFTNTKVELTLRPRNEMPEPPAAKPLPKLVGTLPLLLPGRACKTSEIVNFPVASMSERVMTCRGAEDSMSARFKREPVTSIDWTFWANAMVGMAVKPKQQLTTAKFRGLNRNFMIYPFLYELTNMSI